MPSKGEERIWRVCDMVGDHASWCRLEEIVRCRDCAHWKEVRMDDGNMGHQCSGVFAYIEGNPDGFCYWGRREQ